MAGGYEAWAGEDPAADRISSRTASSPPSASEHTDPDHASRPAQTIEDLAEHGATHQAAHEIAREVQATGRAAVGSGGSADKAGSCCLGEEGAHCNEGQAQEQCAEMRAEQQRQTGSGGRKGYPKGRPRAVARHYLASKRRGDHRGQEDEIDRAQHHHADREGRARQHEIDVSEGADEGEQDNETREKGGTQGGIGEMDEPTRERRAAAHVCLGHRRRPLDAEPHQHRTRKIEAGKHPEIRSQPEVID